MIHLHVRDGRLALHFEKLSDDQRAALVADREVGVAAGAGAGKTSTLAARFVSLLQARVDGGAADIADVLVLTFTEKAAQEMKERCYRTTAAVARALRTDADRLREEGLADGAIRRLRAAWEALRDRFAGAAISTFHGFCARVLREFPAETGTPPGFSVLEGGEADALAAACAAAEVDARIAEDHPDLPLLLRTFRGRQGLVGQLSRLVTRRGELDVALADARAADPAEAALARARPSPDAAAAFLGGDWLDRTDQVLGLCVAIDTPWLARLRALRPRLDEPPDDPLAVYELYRDALTAYVSGGKVRSLKHPSATGAQALWGPRAKEAKAALDAMQPAVDAWNERLPGLLGLPNRHDRTLGRVLRALAEVAQAAIARHEAALRARLAVDFAGLQLRVRDAFADPASPLVAALRARHRFVMVDEFQDTDGLQWDIVRALARPPGQPRDRLFLVGDPKQAIYGFRGGDVQVYDAAGRSVAHAVSLGANYRSRPELIDWFNQLFADVLGPAGPEREAYEAPFAPLTAGRKDTGGTVRIATYEKSGEAEEDAAREAAWIAGLLADEVLPERGDFAGLGLAASPTPPVAILLRRRRHLPAYEAALRRAGIGYVVVGGVGFWSRPEVVDVANLLHALARRDLVSKVGALRSPMLGLTDSQLLALHQAGSLRAFGLAPVPLPPELASAAALWRELATLAGQLPLSDLVHHVIVRTRQAWVQGIAAPEGRGAANLERLLALADAHEQAGGTLDAFAEHLLAKVDEDARDAEAALPTTQARVAILTVHASKGLEYPVVVVPDLGAGKRGGGDAGVLARRVGDRWALACRVPDLHGDVDGDASPGALHALQAHAAALEAAESRRLFYVACTRARDHLVLVGSRKEEAPAQGRAASWSDMVGAHLRDRGERPPWLREIDLGTFHAPEASPPSPAPLPPPDAAALARLPALPPEHRVSISPSSLALFAEDPERWVVRHVFGVPAIAAPGAQDDLGATVASVRGEVLHGLLEDDYLDDERVAEARWSAAARGAGLPEDQVKAGWPTVLAQLRSLRASPSVAAVLAAPGYAELPVRLVRGGVQLEGRIDRLCRDPLDGAWMVVDYKSARPGGTESEAVARHRLQLLAYSAMATRVLAAHGDGGVARAALLFTRSGSLVRLPDWTLRDWTELEGLLADVEARLVEEVPEG